MRLILLPILLLSVASCSGAPAIKSCPPYPAMSPAAKLELNAACPVGPEKCPALDAWLQKIDVLRKQLSECQP